MTTQHLNHFGVVQGLMRSIIGSATRVKLLLAGRTKDQRPNVRFPASARCNQHLGNPGSIARRIMTSNWTSLFVAGLLLFVTTQIAAEEHAVLDKEMFLAAPGSTIAGVKTLHRAGSHGFLVT